ncbi:MAG TPA: 3-oxoacyl-[acyl-carrier-protein] synthase III C-terminal domain-containing protein [Candidatus Krumholzibacteria bacterium]|nr:3-oxoacyl-[acyl-carrier-protein] synthase III C-terminal domain-containing protein [Candidatus Krumholzibacteria bacterium]HPD70627.1 3-oxoacyl-[acyl-carrier-protein] synthase III C-terminal domain-containing protein [Candidatus Krumholzibacteria bacterium]HRY39673.1 3-oxoacyl-[acyl-carrier-protein] synthase III C-terminal domain-containing protein [Candidatus Krumholzibacteria bacterium]
MPRIRSVATAVPAHRVDQDLAREFARRQFGGKIAGIERLLPLFDHAGVSTRYFVAPPEWFESAHDLADRSALYAAAATELSAQAARQAIGRAGITTTDVDYVIYVNTTGLATPSIDARLINALGLRRDVYRTPIWGLGCAGGAAGLSHAYRHALGHPRARILLVATELCGLTFLADDASKSNLVATALFADGAAAAVVCGDAVEGGGLAILDTSSRFYPDSLGVMGWTVLRDGLQVVFARRIPDIVRDNAAAEAAEFLGGHALSVADIDAFLLHPGGTRVLEAYQTAWNLEPAQLEWSRGVLRDYGNMSSTTVLFVIERYLQARGSGGGGYGLISALGPGFCSESLLVAL